MSISNYPHGFRQGAIIGGVPYDLPNPGKVFWVNNSSVLADGGIPGSDSGRGTYLKPFATIDYAVGKCTANRGDVIYVMPGHVETIGAAAAVDFDVAGITVIGLGSGVKRPRLDFTATAGTVEVNADDITLYNLNFHANVSAVVIGLSVLTLATDLTVSNCLFDVETTATDEFLISINLGVGCDRFTCEDTVIDMGLGGAAAGIKWVGASAGANVRRNRIVGDYSLALLSGITTLSTELYIEDNLLMNGGPGNINAVACIVLLTGTTGVCARNLIICDLATHALAIAADTLVYSFNQHTDEAGQGITSSNTSASIVISADA